MLCLTSGNTSHVRRQQPLWWGQCETCRPSSSQLNSTPQTLHPTTISHLLTGLHWSGLQVYSWVDQRYRDEEEVFMSCTFKLLTLYHSFSPLLFPPKITSVFIILLFLYFVFPLFLYSFPSPCFLIPVHKTPKSFHWSWVMRQTFDLALMTSIPVHVQEYVRLCVCVSAAGGWQRHD